MSTELETQPIAESHDEEHEHPSDWAYIKIALLLAVLTAIEVAISYIKGIEGTATQNVLLFGLAIIKFAMVALYFMHLKFDSPFLRRVFVTGIVFALVFYTGYLLTLGVFI